MQVRFRDPRAHLAETLTQTPATEKNVSSCYERFQQARELTREHAN